MEEMSCTRASGPAWLAFPGPELDHTLEGRQVASFPATRAHGLIAPALAGLRALLA